MPEDWMENLKRKIKPEWKTVFLSTFVIGLFTHIYKFTNQLPNWDTLMDYYYPTNNMIHQGRHFQFLTCGISGFTDMPWVIGILCLIYLAAAGALISDLFGLKRKMTLVLTGGLLATFPTFTGCFAFMYMADAFYSALLLSVLAVWLTVRAKRERLGTAAGALLLGVGMGSYQAYLSFAAALALLFLFHELIFEERSVKELLRPCGRLLLMAAGAGIFYFVSLKIMIAVEGIPLNGHQGMGTMGIPSLRQAAGAFISSYVDTVYFFVGSISSINFYGFLNSLLLLLLAAGLLARLLCAWRAKRRAPFLLAAACLILFPPAAHMFYFVTPDVSYHALMQGALCLVYVQALVLYDRKEMKGRLWYWGIFISAALICYTGALAANQNYAALTQSYHKTYALMNRVVERMERLPGFEEADTVAVIGPIPGGDKISLGEHPDIAGYTDGYFITHQKHVVAMLDTFYNVKLKGAGEEETERIMQSEEFKRMGCWPSGDSVRQIGNVIVWKAGSGGE